MPDQIHSYVDEAGDPTLFGRKRGSGVIVGNDGCSKFFVMGKLEVADPVGLSEEMTSLRRVYYESLRVKLQIGSRFPRCPVAPLPRCPLDTDFTS